MARGAQSNYNTQIGQATGTGAANPVALTPITPNQTPPQGVQTYQGIGDLMKAIFPITTPQPAGGPVNPSNPFSRIGGLVPRVSGK